MQAVQNELWNRLSLAKCGDNDNVCEHVDRMCYMLEELLGMGVSIADGEYVAILIKSMPKSFGHYFAAIMAAAEVSGNLLTPTMVMNYAVSEFDRRQIEGVLKRGGTSTGDTALYMFAQSSSGSGQCQRRGSKEKHKCYNCSKTGHLKNVCRSPKKEDNAKESGSGSASQGVSTGSGKPPQVSRHVTRGLYFHLLSFIYHVYYYSRSCD
jgi:hypothetical protein